MRKFVIHYGIIGASISIVFGLLNWFFIAPRYGPNISETIGYLSIIASLLTIPLGIKYFRDKLNNEFVSFSEGFKIGIGITFIASIIMGIYGMLFFAIEGDHFKQWQQQWFTEAELEKAQMHMATIPEYMQSPIFQGLIMFIMVFLIGTAINLTSVLVLKSNTKQVRN
ncbi:DUF4199 domain-containing protein [uncultured Psychroserpens sp.]|uniref:DUF4199 domain-containing protein n=1 Tax=uncultured Psychroserpens sp. TaxID=255436 RepID=UPI0026059861|nr:DUF4199 domain-containing protein [uncultured Psychroserpens sp.]